jgi:hypothetical protein
LGKSIKVFKFVSTFCFTVTKTNKSFRKSKFFLISHFQGFSGETNLWYAFNASLIFEVGTCSLYKIAWTLPMEIFLDKLGKET